jgi:hypothetical protein
VTDEKHRNIIVMNPQTHIQKEIKYFDIYDIPQPQSANSINAFGETRQKIMLFVK